MTMAADWLSHHSAMDDAIGWIRQQLRIHKVAEDTLVFFSGGDNGPEHGTPGSATVDGALLKGRKRDLGEGGIRQAGLVEWPAVITANGATEFPIRISECSLAVSLSHSHHLVVSTLRTVPSRANLLRLIQLITSPL